MAEVQVKDADIIYVQEGSATFVTGGTVVDPKNIASDEVRGAEINGGETRQISKGDVIIVPAGTPHYLGYYPQRAASDPAEYRQIQVRVKDASYVVRTREGYFPGAR